MNSLGSTSPDYESAQTTVPGARLRHVAWLIVTADGLTSDRTAHRTAIVRDETHLRIAFDIEVFIDGGDCYSELGVNAANTVYEVFFVWRDEYTPGVRNAHLPER